MIGMKRETRFFVAGMFTLLIAFAGGRVIDVAMGQTLVSLLMAITVAVGICWALGVPAFRWADRAVD